MLAVRPARFVRIAVAISIIVLVAVEATVDAAAVVRRSFVVVVIRFMFMVGVATVAILVGGLVGRLVGLLELGLLVVVIMPIVSVESRSGRNLRVIVGNRTRSRT